MKMESKLRSRLSKIIFNDVRYILHIDIIFIDWLLYKKPTVISGLNSQ